MKESASGDGWTLHLGDCFDVLRRIPDQSVDLFATDPPYGQTACKWDTAIDLDALWFEVNRLLRPGGAAVFTAMQPFTSRLVMSNPRWFRHACVWDKRRVTGFLDANRKPLRAHEDVLIFAPKRTVYNPQMESGEPYVRRRQLRPTATTRESRIAFLAKPTVSSGGRYPTSVLPISSVQAGKVHPTQKPVALMEYLIRTYSNPGAVVCDPFAGSGTTGVACFNTGRTFVGIEREANYFAIARDRIRAHENPRGHDNAS